MDFWVFAYGSLMWRPNFLYAESAPALIEGAHRALCVYSAVHRGAYWSPGLVLGLDKGGRCQGMTYRIPSVLVHDTRHYLRLRENVTNTYAAVMQKVRLLDGSERSVNALCYMVRRSHRQYTGQLSLERQAYLVRKGVGASGANIDYVVNTVEHLRACGVYDDRLEALMTVLGHGLQKTKYRGTKP